MSNPKNKYVKPHWKKPKDKHVRRGPAYEIVYLPHMKHKTRRVSLRKKVSSKVRVINYTSIHPIANKLV